MEAGQGWSVWVNGQRITQVRPRGSGEHWLLLSKVGAMRVGSGQKVLCYDLGLFRFQLTALVSWDRSM